MGVYGVVMKNHKIEFKFILNRFNYTLPLLGVDLDFLRLRREEVNSCLTQLAKKISTINIASKEGVFEMQIAYELIKHYHYARVLINLKADMIINPNKHNQPMSQAAIEMASKQSSRID